MKACFVSHKSTIGGGEISLLELYKAFLGEKGIVLGENGPLTGFFAEKEIKYCPMPKITLLNIFKILKAQLTLIKHFKRYDYIFCNTARALFYSVLPSKLTNKKIIYFQRTLDNINTISVYVYNKCGKIIAVSKKVKEHLIKRGVKAEKIEVIYNPFNFNEFKLSGRKEEKSDKIRIAYLGRIHKEKQLDKLINLKNKFNCEINIASLQKANNNSVNVYNINPFDYEKLSNFYNNCDIVYFHSEKEGFGRVVIEALYFSKPLILSKTGIAAELMEKEKFKFLNDFIIKPGDLTVEKLENLKNYKIDIKESLKQLFERQIISEKIKTVLKNL